MYAAGATVTLLSIGRAIPVSRHDLVFRSEIASSRLDTRRPGLKVRPGWRRLQAENAGGRRERRRPSENPPEARSAS
jgi:hypothetical protein